MKRIKVVVWDGDNTLWNGTVFYKDKENVSLKPGTKEALKELDKRGIKSTICSKNYYEDVESILKKFEIAKYFQHPQVGWGLKSDAIKNIAGAFNAQFDEMIFVDDDPFQRAEVASQISGINIVPLDDPIDILGLEGVVPLNATEEDRKRVQLLKEQRNREEAEKNFKGNYKDFLKQCSMVMTVRPIEEEDWTRVTQLLNRTNELNATANRYTLEQLKESYEKNNDVIMVVELKDVFGDYGIIAETILENKDYGWFVRDLAVSCRTMGRGIGSALVVAVLNYAKENGIKKVVGRLVETESNWRIRPLYEKRNFRKISSDDKAASYEFDLDKDEMPEYPPWMKVNFLMEEIAKERTG
ncbi:HAD-IIIC family phosphatase [Candidatus Woesearchaeota archaeon]|nr:HAD-IIIC family phosphatase [Candidatus Woesearchaeota archaeon]